MGHPGTHCRCRPQIVSPMGERKDYSGTLGSRTHRTYQKMPLVQSCKEGLVGSFPSGVTLGLQPLYVVDITGNENVDKLAKEARNLNNDNFVNVTLLDANVVPNFKLREKSIPVNHQICNKRGERLITKAIARLRTGHHRGMKFDRNGRIYRNCDNCLDIELTPAHIFDCPSILVAVQEIGYWFRQQTSMWIILNIWQEQSSGPMVLSELVPSWIRHHHHQQPPCDLICQMYILKLSIRATFNPATNLLAGKMKLLSEDGSKNRVCGCAIHLMLQFM
ncbi:RNase H domain-containing protein [Trichonephila clavipes]|nr:RNase H domain-containing protein [Trichonephila clavipes]